MSLGGLDWERMDDDPRKVMSTSTEKVIPNWAKAIAVILVLPTAGSRGRHFDILRRLCLVSGIRHLGWPVMRWFVARINPEPWAIGPVGYSRRGGKMSAYVGQNQQLNAFKEALREELGEQELQDGQHVLYLYFWRNRAEYTTPQARTHRKHEADVTNMQKATEDALQGVLFKNDRDVREVHSFLMDRDQTLEPGIVIGLAPYMEQPLPEAVIALMNNQPVEVDEETEREWDAGVPF